MEASLFDVAGMVREALGAVGDYFGSWFDWLFSPLWLWWGVGVGVFLVLATIAFFLPFKWVRAVIGGIILLGGAFLAGGTQMYRQMKGEVEKEKAKRKVAEQAAKQRRQQSSGGGGSFWPFWVILVVLLPDPANAYTCGQVWRAYQTYGEAVLRVWGVIHGATKTEIRAAESCIRRKKRQSRR